MTANWAARIPFEQRGALDRLRTHSGIEGACADDAIWLRGRDADEALERALRTLPLLEKFDVLEEGRLRPAGALVPTLRLPELNWQPLSQLVRPELPAAAFAGALEQQSPISLSRSTRERSPNVLVAPLALFAEYAGSTAEIRLQGCRFAVRDDGQTLFQGEPLPALPGQRYVEQHGVAVPAGWELAPCQDHQVIAQVLEVAAGELVVFDDPRNWRRSAVTAGSGIRKNSEDCNTASEFLRIPLPEKNAGPPATEFSRIPRPHIVRIAAAEFVRATRVAFRKSQEGLSRD